MTVMPMSLRTNVIEENAIPVVLHSIGKGQKQRSHGDVVLVIRPSDHTRILMAVLLPYYESKELKRLLLNEPFRSTSSLFS